MKRTIFYINAGARIGGAERSLLDLMKYLDRSRFLPVVACPDDGPLGGRILEMGIEVCYFNPAGLRTPGQFLNQLLKLRRFALVHGAAVVHGSSTLSAKHAALLGKLLGIPSVVHVRDQLPPGFSVYFIWLRMADRVIAISRAVLRRVQDAAVARAGLIYNGIDAERFARPGDGAELRSEYGLTRNTPVVGMVGRFSFEKGVPDFLESAALVSRDIPEARFMIAGDAVFPGNRPLQDEAVKLAGNPLLRERVIFTGEREDIEALYAALDVVIVPSRREGFGRVAAEAGAAGKPVVATAVGGLPEIIADGETGILVPPRNPAAMAAAVIGLLRDGDLRRAMGGKARKRVGDFFDIRRTAAETENLYLSLLEGER